MLSINIGKESAESIDARKRAIEFKNSVDFRRLFKNMANDAASLYIATGEVRAQELAENYKLEFTKEIRDTMRMTLKQFGFTIRKTLEEKFDLLFDVETKLLEIELDFKRVQTLDETTQTDAKLEKINKDYLIAAAFFVANESEKQAQFITETNTKEIEAAFTTSAAVYLNQISTLRQQGKIAEAAALQKRQREVIASGAKADIVDKGAYRSQLISEQNVGMTESWARQKEAELVNDAALITTTQKVIQLNKRWFARLDNRTRTFHVQADGQTVGINEKFLVGGEQLNYPRDSENGSASNILRCRCISEHSII
jgi:hypothetical protein